MKTLLFLLVFAATAAAQLVPEVRAAIGRNDFAAGEKLIAEYKVSRGETPESILALSWLGRGAQAAKQWDQADRYAEATRKLALEALKKRKLDVEPSLPLALGASIEVQGHTLAGRGQRTEAVLFLQGELKRWRSTSIRTRIQKNLHLVSLEGKPAPALEMTEYLGAKPAPLASLKGKPLVLFFWAHWCGDCKQQAPVLMRLLEENKAKGLMIVGPTQPYGYVAGGVDAPRADEVRYIDQVRRGYYANLEMTVPLSEENFKSWGCSTSPTLALVDRQGIVRLYNPGMMTYEQLAPRVAQIVAGN